MLICYNIRDKFTSHYVSINSKAGTEKETSTTKFTSHYVSINSVAFNPSGVLISAFTSHYVSINSYHHSEQYITLLYLHPTMYLLILSSDFILCSLSSFTSHYVSINSPKRRFITASCPTFTSHYVSINSSDTTSGQLHTHTHLHPTMYLLILLRCVLFLLLLRNLHPTMYLLIPKITPALFSSYPIFTSHYVSINSLLRLPYYIQLMYLHPTMYLLIQKCTA